MISIALLTLKKTIALFAMVGPEAMVPVFLSMVKTCQPKEKVLFARSIGTSVAVALLVAAFLGTALLDMLGVSVGAMQIGGGIIVLMLALAMVLGKETTFKGAEKETVEPQDISIVPLAIPLLAGPAAFSYVIGNSVVHSPTDLIHIVLPIILIGAITWGVFLFACRAEKQIKKSQLDLIERLSGFILAALAIEMMATGLRSLFPLLTVSA